MAPTQISDVFDAIAGKPSDADGGKIDIKATGKLAKLYDALLKLNPEWATSAKRHDLNRFMTRLIFCFFAEDVGIFPKGQFTRLIDDFAGENGQEAHGAIIHAFRAMGQPLSGRADMPMWTHELEYVKGGLFVGDIDCPQFNPLAWSHFQDAAKLDWRKISPDIFGSMIQSIIDPAARSELGMHYTSEPNILKVLGPILLHELDAEIHKHWGCAQGLRSVLARLGRIRLFDPACGSGNFLVVAYRQLRDREMKILGRIGELAGGTQVEMQSSIRLAQFHGIEITDFGAQTAKLALFIAAHQADAAMAELLGQPPAEMPMWEGRHILCGNSLRLDWEDACPPPVRDDEVFIVGNPPFLGFKGRSKEQNADMAIVFEGRADSYGLTDYAACFFLKAADYLRAHGGEAVFVSTNSMVQGASAATVWPSILHGGVFIRFGYTSFRWSSNAARPAGVDCVIVGLSRDKARERVLFDKGTRVVVRNINAYLQPAPNVVVRREDESLFGLPKMQLGNAPKDNGRLILSEEEAADLLRQHPEASKFVYKFLGAQEVVKGISRYCLWIDEEALPEALAIEPIRRRINEVREFRLASVKAATRRMAERPFEFDEIRLQPGRPSILVPSVSSERRPYLPVDLVGGDVISSNLNFVLYDAPKWCLALVASRLHLVWIGAVCGKMKSDFRYSNTLGWNTFPVPRFTEAQLEQIEASAEAILWARGQHPGKSIASLYDPEKMPENLREAHLRNDELLESMYIGRPFQSDIARLEKLFILYAERIGVAVDGASGFQVPEAARLLEQEDRHIVDRELPVPM
jgi:hypothetical protein